MYCLPLEESESMEKLNPKKKDIMNTTVKEREIKMS